MDGATTGRGGARGRGARGRGARGRGRGARGRGRGRGQATAASAGPAAPSEPAAAQPGADDSAASTAAAAPPGRGRGGRGRGRRGRRGARDVLDVVVSARAQIETTPGVRGRDIAAALYVRHLEEVPQEPDKGALEEAEAQRERIREAEAAAAAAASAAATAEGAGGGEGAEGAEDKGKDKAEGAEGAEGEAGKKPAGAGAGAGADGEGAEGGAGGKKGGVFHRPHLGLGLKLHAPHRPHLGILPHLGLSIPMPGFRKGAKGPVDTAAVLEDLHIVAVVVKRSSKKGKIVWLKKDDSETTSSSYMITKDWRFEQLIRIETVKADDSVFILIFKRPFIFKTASRSDRDEFLCALYYSCQEILQTVPDSNFDIQSLSKSLMGELSGGAMGKDLKMMSADEVKDIMEILGMSDSHKDDSHKDLTNLEETCFNISSDLWQLENQNVRDLMETTDSVLQVLGSITVIERKVSALLNTLADYSSQLDNMKKDMKLIESKNNRMDTITTNQKALQNELNTFLESITVEKDTRDYLEADDSNLATKPGLIPKMVECAHLLSQAMAVPQSLPRSMAAMSVVKQQKGRLTVLRDDFVARLERVVLEKISQLEKFFNEKKPSSSSIQVKTHEIVFNTLRPYTELMAWMKLADQEILECMWEEYLETISKIYQRDTKEFFSLIRDNTIRDSREHRERLEQVLFSTSSSKLKRSQLPLPAKPIENKCPPGKFPADNAFTFALNSIMKLIKDEQDFLVSFFQLDIDAPQETNKVESSLEKMFPDAAELMIALLETARKSDPFYLFSALLDIEMQLRTANAYMATTCRLIHQSCKQFVSIFLDDQVAAITNTQLIGTKGYGIAPHFMRYQAFVDYMEGSTTGRAADKVDTDDLDVAWDALETVTTPSYLKITHALFDWLNTMKSFHDHVLHDSHIPLILDVKPGDLGRLVAPQPQPVPNQVVTTPKRGMYILRIENYEYFADSITPKCRKVKCLNQFVETAKQESESNMRALCNKLLNDKFATLMSFFMGVDSLLHSGIPPEDIQYQTSHSKRICTQVLESLQPVRVKHILVQILKSIKSNSSSDINVAELIWKNVQAEMSYRLGHISDILLTCYSSSSTSPMQPPVSQEALRSMFNEIWITKH
ncbi:exocyst complex subunit 1 [Pelomyxa schiedti]|nr:exocyst complex subunit 1 [Pelomyxa schiedti]